MCFYFVCFLFIEYHFCNMKWRWHRRKEAVCRFLFALSWLTYGREKRSVFSLCQSENRNGILWIQQQKQHQCSLESRKRKRNWNSEVITMKCDKSVRSVLRMFVVENGVTTIRQLKIAIVPAILKSSVNIRFWLHAINWRKVVSAIFLM